MKNVQNIANSSITNIIYSWHYDDTNQELGYHLLSCSTAGVAEGFALFLGEWNRKEGRNGNRKTRLVSDSVTAVPGLIRNGIVAKAQILLCNRICTFTIPVQHTVEYYEFDEKMSRESVKICRQEWFYVYSGP
jgi:hypothetical protein